MANITVTMTIPDDTETRKMAQYYADTYEYSGVDTDAGRMAFMLEQMFNNEKSSYKQASILQAQQDAITTVDAITATFTAQ